MTKHPEFKDQWQKEVTHDGWYAWRYQESPPDEILGIQWIDTEEVGGVKMVVFFSGGYCQRRQWNKLLGFLVCPVSVVPDVFGKHPKSL